VSSIVSSIVTGPKRLVVGSYPPVPGPAAAATVGAVRRAWAIGVDVAVASPRPSAAAHLLEVSGGRGLSRQIGALARRLGCDQVVLCIEPGWPLLGGHPARAARSLAGTLGRFGWVELVVTGPPSGFANLLPALAPLWPTARAVVAGSEALAAALRGAGAEYVQVIEPFAGARLPAGLLDADAVGPLEPAALLLATRARRWVGRVARRVLGRRAPAVRAWLARLRRSLRRGT
jgi:hypothetical protein